MVKQDYYNMVASAAQVVGRPNASKKEILGTLERFTRDNGVQLDKGAFNDAFRRFKQVPVNRSIGF